MSTNILRVGGGYTNRCSKCDFFQKEIEKYKAVVDMFKNQLRDVLGEKSKV